jgi:transposase
MTRPYSDDLRASLVRFVEAGHSRRQAAAVFGVSPASAVRWLERYSSTGSTAAKPMGGHRPYALAGERDWLLARLAEQPDVTLRGLLAELAGRGVVVSYYAVWHFFEHEGISFKKKPLSQRAGAGRRRPPARQVEAAPEEA